MRKVFSTVFAGALMLGVMPSVVLAAPVNADLRVQLQGPASVPISIPTTYTVVVSNLGPATTAQSVQLTVEFPLTNTSPAVTILGTVSGLDQRCSIVANKLSCALGNVRKNHPVSITYTYAAPVSTKVLTMKAVVTSATNDNNSANNTSSRTPNLSYPSRVIPTGTTTSIMTNSHCTGTNLTSYFECMLYSSSISSHVTTFNGDLSITFSEPGYTGTWSQPTPRQLHFEYFEGTDKVVEFNGYAINGANCFDGMTTFFPASNYVSPYHVCLQ